MVKLFIGVGNVVDCLEDLLVEGGELDVATSHHSMGNVEELVQRNVGEPGRATFAERSNKVARESRAVNVDAYAYDGCSVEHAVDTGFGVVAHDESAEL